MDGCNQAETASTVVPVDGGAKIMGESGNPALTGRIACKKDRRKNPVAF